MFEVHKARQAVGAINDEYAAKKNLASGSLRRTYDNIPSLGHNDAGELRINPATIEAHQAYRDTLGSLRTARQGAITAATSHLSAGQFGKVDTISGGW